MNKNKFLFLTFLSLFCSAVIFNTAQIRAQDLETTNKVLLKSEVEWEDLNPARGDKSPKAGTLWGNRKGEGATGFLLNPVDGFKSPPHIHNVSYRGIVISGLIHNDDPNAESMWMPKGSFWTQPKGEVHITAAEGSNTLAYIEIEKGPYLVLPTEKAFDNGERPVNIDEMNIVWLDASNVVWIDQSLNDNIEDSPNVSFLWGNPNEDELRGMLIKFPLEFEGDINSFGSTLNAVIIQGQLQYKMPNKDEIKTLESGSYFSSEGKSIHQITSISEEETIIYIRTNGKVEVN